MQTAYTVLLWVSVAIAILFVLLILLTGKGDAMSGGAAGVRTSFKGKASFDDQISKITLYMGITFMGMMLVLDWLAHRAF